jgi:hypothetical protein
MIIPGNRLAIAPIIRGIEITSMGATLMDSGAVSSSVISYVRGPQTDLVLGLANRLNAEGVPCELDLFEPRPAGGWSRWMTEQMSRTEVVLVVCSQPYYERYRREAPPGVGEGATFESGLLNRRVVAAQGFEHGVIPIVFDRSDVQWIPEFLRDETRFVLPEQYDELYAVLTGQRLYPRPPLGPVRRLTPVEPPQLATPMTSSLPQPTPSSSQPQLPLAVFKPHDSNLIFARYSEFERNGTAIRLTLSISDDEGAARLSHLRNHSQAFQAGWGLEAAMVRVSNYRDLVRGGRRVVELDLTEEQSGSSWMSEMNLGSVSADEIARRRARRILLDEGSPTAAPLSYSTQALNDHMVERAVSGAGSGMSGSFIVSKSPLPPLVTSGLMESEMIEIGRLLCALMLVTTKTVERINRLELAKVETGFEVDFVGYRARRFQNQDPVKLEVLGICPTT